MILTEENFIDANEHFDGCCGIEGLENIPYEEKKKMALEEANEFLAEYKTTEEAWKAIRNNKECFTEENGCSDTGNLYLGFALLTAPRDIIKVYWDVRED